MATAKGIDKLTVVEAYPGCWSVDAEGVQVIAPSAAEAVLAVQRALIGE